MVIDCLVEAGDNGESTLPIRFDKSQRFDLEGDFYKYFALYAPDTYGVSALAVIAPDAMDAILRMEALCDIEIIDNYIYFYWPDNAQTPESYEKDLETVESIIGEIGEKLTKDDIFATKSQARVHAEGANGVRLNRNSLTLAGIVSLAIIFGIIFIMVFYKGNAIKYADVAYWIFIVGAILLSVYQSVRKSRLRKQLNARYHNDSK
jgi:hypothetical protein